MKGKPMTTKTKETSATMTSAAMAYLERAGFTEIQKDADFNSRLPVLSAMENGVRVLALVRIVSSGKIGSARYRKVKDLAIWDRELKQYSSVPTRFDNIEVKLLSDNQALLRHTRGVAWL